MGDGWEENACLILSLQRVNGLSIFQFTMAKEKTSKKMQLNIVLCYFYTS